MKIIGGDFNAELGPGEGVELSCVGHYTLNKANCRGEWMTQWLLEKNLVALNTMYKKLPYKQVTYHAPKGGKKQLDYILTDRNNYGWSKDAEANDKIDVGSDRRCVMAKFEIPKKRKRQHVATRCPQSKLKEKQAEMNMSRCTKTLSRKSKTQNQRRHKRRQRKQKQQR